MLARLSLVVLAVLSAGFAHIRAGDSADAPYLRWSQGFAVPIYVHGDGYSRVPFADVRAAIEGALVTWNDVERSTLVFVRDGAGPDGDTPAVDGVNMVRFEERALPPEIDPERVLAWTSPVSVACTGVIIEADITFNAVTVRWSTGQGGRLSDIETVALHEIGHLLGLDHSRDRDAVMFPSVQERLRRDLHADDVAGAQATYAPGRGGPCDANRDCGGGEVCLFSVRSDDRFDQFCGPPLGQAAPGARCDARGGACDSGCANGLCFDGACSAICAGDRDCPQGWACVSQDVDGSATSFCIDARRCDADRDVCPAGQACGLVLDAHDDLLEICVDAGDRPDGADCDAGDQCQGGVCLGSGCARTCDDDADCGELTCETVGLPVGGGRSVPVDLCVLDDTPCARDRDCPAGQVCGYMERDGRLLNRCGPPSGAAPGVACRRDGDCRAGICLPEGLCSAVCRSDGDCPDNMECDRVERDGAALPACVLTPGAAADASLPPPARDAAPLPVDLGPPIDAAPGTDPAPPIDAAPPAADARRGGTVVISQQDPGDGGCSASPTTPAPWWPTLALLALARKRRRHA